MNNIQRELEMKRFKETLRKADHAVWCAGIGMIFIPVFYLMLEVLTRR